MQQMTIEQMNEKFNELNEKFEKLKEDLIVAKRTEDSYQRHENGDFIKKSKQDFLQEIEKW